MMGALGDIWGGQGAGSPWGARGARGDESFWDHLWDCWGLMAAHSAVNPLNAQSPRDPGVQFIPFSPYSLSDQESPGNAAEHCPCFMKC